MISSADVGIRSSGMTSKGDEAMRVLTMMKRIAAVTAFVLFLMPRSGRAFTTVISTSTVLEQQFLAATSSQFNVTIQTNPFFPNTYTVNLAGRNPNYVPTGGIVPSAPCNLDMDIAALVAASTETYLYGWQDGATYLSQSEIDFTGAMANLCQNATNFALVNASTKTWNVATCQDALGAVINQLFAVNTGTPTVIPGEP